MKKYDLIILGGGAAAFAAANTSNELKKKTLVINDEKILPLGGTCVNVGCIPSKIMLYQGANYYYSIRSKFRAIRLKGSADFIEALKETKEMVEEFQEKNYKNVIEKQEYVDFKEGKAEFLDEHSVRVGNEKYEADYFIISTGASTFVPLVKGIEKISYLTNVNIFNLEKKPKSIIIFGGGPQAMEFSQIFHHFGIKVTILQRSDKVLSKMESILGEELKKYLEEEGIKIYTRTSIEEIKKISKGVEVTIFTDGEKKKINSELFFVGTGIKPNIERIGIGKVGVKLDERGFIKTDKYLQTSQKNIYATGDVTGLMPLETVAAKQGNFAVRNIFENAKKIINYEEIPQAVFTSPEVATIGVTEEEYIKKYKTCLCRTISFENVEKALAIKNTRGTIKMVLDHKTKQVLGVHIIGPMAADIITTATYAVKNKMTIDDIKDTVHIFPTLSEVIKKVAQSFYQNLDDIACCVE